MRPTILQHSHLQPPIDSPAPIPVAGVSWLSSELFSEASATAPAAPAASGGGGGGPGGGGGGAAPRVGLGAGKAVDEVQGELTGRMNMLCRYIWMYMVSASGGSPHQATVDHVYTVYIGINKLNIYIYIYIQVLLECSLEPHGLKPQMTQLHLRSPAATPTGSRPPTSPAPRCWTSPPRWAQARSAPAREALRGPPAPGKGRTNQA